MKHCSHCGKTLDPGAENCVHCGSKVPPPPRIEGNEEPAQQIEPIAAEIDDPDEDAVKPPKTWLYVLIAVLLLALTLLLYFTLNQSPRDIHPPYVPPASESPEPGATLKPIPTMRPTPTAAPTATPTVAPTATPTVAPTATPTVAPTATPTVAPTATPTVAPTATPTAAPTAMPTVAPTATPTVAPTATPTVAPTATPTVAPTATPTVAPTETPTVAPTPRPTVSATPTTPAPTPTPRITPFPAANPSESPAITSSPSRDPAYTASHTPVPLAPTSFAVIPASPTEGPTEIRKIAVELDDLVRHFERAPEEEAKELVGKNLYLTGMLVSLSKGTFDLPGGIAFAGYELELNTGDSALRLMVYAGEDAFTEFEPPESAKLVIDGVVLGLFDGKIVIGDAKILESVDMKPNE